MNKSIQDYYNQLQNQSWTVTTTTGTGTTTGGGFSNPYNGYVLYTQPSAPQPIQQYKPSNIDLSQAWQKFIEQTTNGIKPQKTSEEYEKEIQELRLKLAQKDGEDMADAVAFGKALLKKNKEITNGNEEIKVSTTPPRTKESNIWKRNKRSGWWRNATRQKLCTSNECV